MSRLRTDIAALVSDQLDSATFQGAQVCVVVPDRTRPIDYERHVGPLLEGLVEVGAEPTVLVALGLHRPASEEELAGLRSVAEPLDVPVDQHDAASDALIEVDPDVSEGRPGWPILPARFHPDVVDCDIILNVSTVEPHQYAGFSGGAKGVAIGCASRQTIGAMHGLDFLRDRGTRLGSTEGNPFHKALWRLVDDLPPLWGLQIVPSGADELPVAALGPIDEAFQEAAEAAHRRFFVPYETRYDWLHLPVPDEKAGNFYQASRAATYVALVSRPVVAEGGTLIVEASCPEGIGQGAGEQACGEAMERGREVLLEELRGDQEVETTGGQQRAYVIARTLAHCEVVLVGAPTIEPLEAMGIRQFDTVAEAKAQLGLDQQEGRRLDEVFHGVPILQN
jgi:nickel-dependent lactate racemase